MRDIAAPVENARFRALQLAHLDKPSVKAIQDRTGPELLIGARSACAPASWRTSSAPGGDRDQRV
jgi:hypothetical protein